MRPLLLSLSLEETTIETYLCVPIIYFFLQKRIFRTTRAKRDLGISMREPENHQKTSKIEATSMQNHQMCPHSYCVAT